METREDKTLIASNRRARFEYFLSDFIEVGIVLKGTEIKSIRKGHASITDSYVDFQGSEAFVHNMDISIYEQGNIFNHEPKRVRKLLMHKREILKYSQQVKLKGYTVVPVSLYLRNGRAKLEIALAKGKNVVDKRETIKKREIERDLAKTYKR